MAYGLPESITEWARRPTGSAAQTMDRANITSIALANTSGVLRATSIGLLAGETVSSISFLSGSTLVVSPTHQWFALLDSTGKVVAVTADATSAAWAINAVKTLALTAAYHVPESKLYYLARLVTATTMPTSAGFAAQAAAAALTPVVAGTAGSGLTTPSTVGTQFALASTTSMDYAYVS